MGNISKFSPFLTKLDYYMVLSPLTNIVKRDNKVVSLCSKGPRNCIDLEWFLSFFLLFAVNGNVFKKKNLEQKFTFKNELKFTISL